MTYDLLDTFYELGGNFVDTANAYQGGQSEEWIGDWMAERGRRNEMVIATKYTMTPMAGKPVNQSNYGGTGSKTMHISIEASLKALKTDYIDIVSVVLGVQVECNGTDRDEVLRPRLGLCDLHPRTHAIPQHPRPTRQSPLPRNLRRTRLARHQSQCLRSPPRPAHFQRLPGSLLRSAARHGT